MYYLYYQKISILHKIDTVTFIISNFMISNTYYSNILFSLSKSLILYYVFDFVLFLNFLLLFFIGFYILETPYHFLHHYLLRQKNLKSDPGNTIITLLCLLKKIFWITIPFVIFILVDVNF